MLDLFSLMLDPWSCDAGYACKFHFLAWCRTRRLILESETQTYDYLLTFSDEKEFVWPSRLSVIKAAFLLNRYTPFIAIGGLLYGVQKNFLILTYPYTSFYQIVFLLIKADDYLQVLKFTISSIVQHSYDLMS